MNYPRPDQRLLRNNVWNTNYEEELNHQDFSQIPSETGLPEVSSVHSDKYRREEAPFSAVKSEGLHLLLLIVARILVLETAQLDRRTLLYIFFPKH